MPRHPSPPRPDAALPPGAVSCDSTRLAPNNSYGTEYTLRGYYLDKPFVCRDCGREEVWTARQQQWWYEVAQGEVNSTAIRCRACRQAEQARRQEARQQHLQGLANKHRPPR